MLGSRLSLRMVVALPNERPSRLRLVRHAAHDGADSIQNVRVVALRLTLFAKLSTVDLAQVSMGIRQRLGID